LKFKGKLPWIRVKREEKESDVEKEIRVFLDKKLTYFYTDMDGNKFAEVHMDVLYSYSNDDKNLPPLG
jgi:hypothetical protein